MVFSGIEFLYYFLPIFLFLYYLLPVGRKNYGRNLVLVLFSLIFYGWGEPIYVSLMLLSILLSYFYGLGISYAKRQHKGLCRTLFILSLLTHIGILLYYKYTGFFLSSLNQFTKGDLSIPSIALPLGISFYTFQILSYLIDLYLGRISPQKNLLHYATYVCMFPQLVAGPIVRYQTIAPALVNRRPTKNELSTGITRFIYGLSKKVLLADSFGKLCDLALTSADPSILWGWIRAIGFTLQIYYDFSGYSDMAIGLGKMLGFPFPENFNYPYISKSVTEFWRRWHMTLGGWFRDYVYIPLGGNRCSLPRFLLNILIVWALTGLWHGASWNFVLWGLYYGLLLLLEKLVLKHLPRFPLRICLQHIYVLLITIFGFVLFQNTTMESLMLQLQTMFGIGAQKDLPFASMESLYYLRSYALLLLLGMVFAAPVVPWLKQRLCHLLQKQKKGGNALYFLFEAISTLWLLFLLILCSAYLVDESFHPFLYFRF